MYTYKLKINKVKGRLNESIRKNGITLRIKSAKRLSKDKLFEKADSYLNENYGVRLVESTIMSSRPRYFECKMEVWRKGDGNAERTSYRDALERDGAYNPLRAKKKERRPVRRKSRNEEVRDTLRNWDPSMDTGPYWEDLYNRYQAGEFMYDDDDEDYDYDDGYNYSTINWIRCSSLSKTLMVRVESNESIEDAIIRNQKFNDVRDVKWVDDNNVEIINGERKYTFKLRDIKM